MNDASQSRIQTDRADQTRSRILAAAINEFSMNGLAGARTEHIAEAAGVNKALLYYYFSGKDALYDAALDSVAQKVVASSMAAMEGDRSAGARVLQFALNHFDRIHSHRGFQSLMQQEMMRLRRGEKNALTPMVDRVFKPMMLRLRQLFAEGKDSGELIEADELQFMYAALGANVFYFLSAPVMGILTGNDPFDPSALELRRRAAVEYLGKTIFTDREYGARVAARVLEGTPMPKSSELPAMELQASKTVGRKVEGAAPPENEVRGK